LGHSGEIPEAPVRQFGRSSRTETGSTTLSSSLFPLSEDRVDELLTSMNLTWPLSADGSIAPIFLRLELYLGPAVEWIVILCRPVR
jgi:hypothetical protein